MQKILKMLCGNQLLKAILKLKEREQQILFARVFGELEFREIGVKFGISAKQVESVYYYAVRKVRKEMEETGYGF